MPGPPPKLTRRRANIPKGGDWKPAAGSGWQHGPIPEPPPGLRPSSGEVWQSWFKGWWAANWKPDYLTQIRKAIQLYDATEGGDFRQTSELRQWMDGLGVTFKGQQMLRWAPPKDATRPAVKPDAIPAAGRFEHLRVVNE